MTSYVVPLIFLSVLVAALIKKTQPYSAFANGAAGATELIKTVLPYLLVVMVALRLFRDSGVSEAVARFLSPVFGFFGLPVELCELILIRPLSGAGALGILGGIYDAYGTDSFIGCCASVIYGSSETVFYLSGIYFSRSSVKRLRYAIPVALVANFTGYTVGCLFLSLFFR
ncbi:MAG: nucleoside recognition domain-containing protein [Candidatus Neoclostridium sp.]